MLKKIVVQSVKVAVLLVLSGLILTGCASQTGKTTRQYDENWRFVPRVHVEDNSFGVAGGAEYRNCSYDIRNEGYWCPIR